MSNALASDSIGDKCLIFLNLFEGFEPIISSVVSLFFKKEYFFSNSSALILSCRTLSHL